MNICPLCEGAIGHEERTFTGELTGEVTIHHERCVFVAFKERETCAKIIEWLSTRAAEEASQHRTAAQRQGALEVAEVMMRTANAIRDGRQDVRASLAAEATT